MTAPATQAAAKLPELPEPQRFFGHSTLMPMWCTEEMRAYALSALSANEAEVGRLREALTDAISELEQSGMAFDHPKLVRLRAALTQGEKK